MNVGYAAMVLMGFVYLVQNIKGVTETISLISMVVLLFVGAWIEVEEKHKK